MTFAIISDMRGTTETQFAVVQGILDAALPSGSRIHGAELPMDGWRLAENWASMAAMSVLFQPVFPTAADIADGEPTWEDAEWQ